ncbi:hypothetical protein COP2_024320 [Malus domestica]
MPGIMNEVIGFFTEISVMPNCSTDFPTTFDQSNLAKKALKLAHTQRNPKVGVLQFGFLGVPTPQPPIGSCSWNPPGSPMEFYLNLALKPLIFVFGGDRRWKVVEDVAGVGWLKITRKYGGRWLFGPAEDMVLWCTCAIQMELEDQTFVGSQCAIQGEP